MKLLTQNQIEYLIIGAFSLRVFSIIAFAYPILKATTLERSAGVMVVIIFCLILLKKILNKESFHIYWLTLFLFYVFLTTVIHHGLKNALTDKNIEYPFHLLTLFLVMTEIKSEQSFLFILKVFVFMGVLQALIGFSQVFFGYPVYHHLIIAGESGFSSDRNYFAYLIPGLSKNTVLASGSFHHFNEFGLFLVINIGIAYGLYLHNKQLIWRISMTIIFVGLVCAFSRGSLLSCFLCLGFIYFSTTKQGFFKLIFVIIIVGSFYILFKAALSTYFEETQNADVRSDTWKFAYDHCIRHPINLIFGNGLYYLKDKVLIQASIIYNLQENLIMNNIHSSHLQIFFEQGFVGSFLFYSTILLSLYRLIITNNTWAICLAGISLGYLFGEIFEHFLLARNGFWYFSLFGLISAQILRKN